MEETFKNYIYNTVYQILLIILPIVTTPYTSRILGVDNIGIYNYTYTVVYYFILGGLLGLDLYGRREVSYCKNDKDKLSLLFSQLILLRILLMTVSLILYLIVAVLSVKYKVYYYVFVILLVSYIFDVSWLFQGLEQFKVLTIRSTIIKIINVICIFVFVNTKNDLWIYIVIISCSQLFSALVMWTQLSRVITLKIPKIEGISKHIKVSAILFLPEIITTIYTMADKLMLGALTSETQLGLYSQSERIIKLALSVIGSMGVVMMPRIANNFVKGDKEEILRCLNKTSKWCFFIGLPMILGLVAISNHFTSWFFGPGYESVASLMCVISPIILLIGLSDVYGMQYLIPTNQNKYYIIAACAGAIVNVILNLMLIPSFAAIGSSIATVISELTVTYMMYKFASKTIPLKFYVPVECLKSACIMFAVIKIMDIVLPIGAIYTFIEILVGASVYSGMVVKFKDTMALELVNSIWKRRSLG